MSGAGKSDSATPGRTAETSGPFNGLYHLAARAHGTSGLGEAHYQVMRALEAELLGSGQSLAIVTGQHPVVVACAHGGFERGIIRPAFQALFGAQRKLGKSICMLVMEGISRALSMAKPLVYAAGHEHSLQLSN
jgi:hypothetical protein